MNRKPLRICHLGKYYPPAPGGIESHVQTLARAQVELGADVRVICINHADVGGKDVTWNRYGATNTTEETDCGVKVTRLGRSATVARLDIVPGVPRLIHELHQSEIDILHLHAPNPTMMVTVAALRKCAPLVVSHHSDVVRQRILRYAYSPFERSAYRRASAILCSSEIYANGSPLVQEFAEKVKILPYGVQLTPFVQPSDSARQHAARIRKEHEANGPIWLCVGRCVYYKGMNSAIAALKHVPGTLIIIGSGPSQNALRNQAADLGVADRVVWWGYATQDELVGAYHAATALWFPSSHKSESFGITQVEAMAAGLPVINTAIADSGVSWVSQHNNHGITIPINEPQALASAASRLWQNPATRQRLGQAARDRAHSEFDHTMMARRSLDIYEQILTPQAVATHNLHAMPSLHPFMPAANGVADMPIAVGRVSSVR